MIEDRAKQIRSALALHQFLGATTSVMVGVTIGFGFDFVLASIMLAGVNPQSLGFQRLHGFTGGAVKGMLMLATIFFVLTCVQGGDLQSLKERGQLPSRAV